MPIKITMPALSPTMEEGTLAKWLVKEGDSVESGDVIAEIETDKATMEVEAADEGTLGKILVEEGTEGVPVNAVIAVLLEEGESAEDIDASSLRANEESDATQSAEEEETDNRSPRQPSAPRNDKTDTSVQNNNQNKTGRIFASPLARRLAEQKGLDLANIKGSGPRGRIIKADIERAEKQAPGKAAPETAGKGPVKTNEFGMDYIEIPNNKIRKITARRLLESKQSIPHFYLTIDCEIDDLLAARKRINEQADGVYKLSVNDFIIKAAAMALKAYPDANVSWTEEAIRQYQSADISVAVATPNGLITPIVKAAEDKGLRKISEEVKDLAGRARDGKLKPEEFQGGSFTVSNLGMYGIREFGAIINPPQSCILAVGAGSKQPVIRGSDMEIATVMTCTLSVDHRSVDGAAGAEYLQYFKRFIENPVSMLV